MHTVLHLLSDLNTFLIARRTQEATAEKTTIHQVRLNVSRDGMEQMDAESPNILEERHLMLDEGFTDDDHDSDHGGKILSIHLSKLLILIRLM